MLHVQLLLLFFWFVLNIMPKYTYKCWFAYHPDVADHGMCEYDVWQNQRKKKRIIKSVQQQQQQQQQPHNDCDGKKIYSNSVQNEAKM